ncbi:uncharacterized protein [Physcomitrium patens]|uniref:uncharacterized protein isoform X2 n=1 Tax=Physcomitrium patens TaxID=3218 RepID=UPI003CCD905A
MMGCMLLIKLSLWSNAASGFSPLRVTTRVFTSFTRSLTLKCETWRGSGQPCTGTEWNHAYWGLRPGLRKSMSSLTTIFSVSLV